MSVTLLPSRVVCDGNSITAGQGLPYPFQLASLFAKEGVEVMNVGVNGQTTQQLIDALPAKAAANFVAGAELIYFEQYNSFNPTNGNSTVAAEQTRAQAYVAQAKAAGFKVWICTPPLTSDTDINDKIVLYTAWLRSNHAFADGFIDLQAMPQLNPAGAAANPTYYRDSAHLTTLGYGAVAAQVHTTLTARLRAGRASYQNFMRCLLDGTCVATHLAETLDDAGNLVLTPS